MNVKVLKDAGLSLVIAASLGLVACGGQQQQQQAAAPQIATVTVGYQNANLESAYPATIKGRTDIDIRPQVTGFITKVHVDEGQQVKKGQVLFTLDQVQFQAAVDAAAAAVRVAESAVSTAQLTADNKRSLYDKNIISEYEWQMADNSLAQAKAQLSQAQANLITARKNLNYTVVTAPSDGVVGSIPNREGSLASPSMAQPLTTVSDNSEVYAYFSLNEKDILRLTDNGAASLNSRIGDMPEVSLRLADGTVYPIKGRVATVSGVIDNSTGAANVRALFPNTNGMLRSGSTGSILIPQDNDSALVIPQKATFEIQDRRYVYVVGDSNKVAQTYIQVAPENNGKEYVVTSGLKPGDRVVVEGVGTQVKNNMVITPVDAAAAQQQTEAAAQSAAQQ
ncbi:MAG: efflux RND transporter periplasmic adaptor subunit [Pseudoflavonifractor sp.]|nr:efflux RND transporter periplasmic adaptor subunit [Pseudoflavonifractor sp.]